MQTPPRKVRHDKSKILAGTLALGSFLILSLRKELNYFERSTSNLDLNILKPTIKWSPKSQAVPCPVGTTVDATLFKAQFGEDHDLMAFFGTLCDGTYLEMGALDGVMFSNSYAFRFGLGWKGFLLEASPRNYKSLVKNRPNELAVVHAGVCAKAQDLHWVEGKFQATGGFLEFASKHHKTKFFTEATLKNAQVVKCQPLQDILDERFDSSNLFFDFYSLDIEGGELAALQTIDFDRVSFGVILVESSGQNLLKDMAVRTLLEAQGYRYLENNPSNSDKKTMESDWFIHKEWHSIYKDLVYIN